MNKKHHHQEFVLPQTALMAHSQATQKMLSHCSERVMKNCMASATVMPELMKKDTITELMQLNSSVFNRLHQQYQESFNGFSALITDYVQIKNANTMTKFVAQQFNLLGQFGQLMQEQTTNLLTLQENIEVDYAYWVNKKVHSK